MESATHFTADLERRLIRLAQAGQTEARDRLVLLSLPFVRKYLRLNYPTIEEQDFNDLLHESVPVLISCIDRYDLTHPARARMHVFSRAYIHKAIVDYYRPTALLTYSDQPPEVAFTVGPECEVDLEQSIALTRRALGSLSPLDRDVLCSRHAAERPLPRRALAARHRCTSEAIRHAEHRAFAQFRSALVPLPS